MWMTFAEVRGMSVEYARDAHGQLATSTPPPARTGVLANVTWTAPGVQAKQRGQIQRETSVHLTDQAFDVPMAALAGRNAACVRTWGPPV